MAIYPVIHKETKGYGYSYADLPTIFDKINPFVQMKWAQKEYSYTAKTEENPYYFYSGAKTI